MANQTEFEEYEKRAGEIGHRIPLIYGVLLMNNLSQQIKFGTQKLNQTMALKSLKIAQKLVQNLNNLYKSQTVQNDFSLQQNHFFIKSSKRKIFEQSFQDYGNKF